MPPLHKAAEDARQILRPDAPVIVALSGGADSVALLDLLASLGYECIAAHCNFGLRGEESDRDEAHAAATARSLGVEFEVKRFATQDYARARGISLEMAARELRYAWFEELRRERGAQAIAVAHHRDDNAETMMLNMLRRTGLRGLAGMKPVNGRIARPLLRCSRREIEEYLSERGVKYVTDSSNLANDFRRNKLRNAVMPVLRQQFPDADEAIAETMGYLRQTQEFLDSITEEKRLRYTDADGRIDVAALAADEPRHAALLLHEMLREQGLTMAVAADIARSASSSGKRFRLGKGELRLDRGRLSIWTEPPLSSEARTVSLSEAPFELTVKEAAEFKPRKGDPFTIYLDESALGGEPVFELRPWRQGDRIDPYGMRGSRLLSDLYRDARYTAADKERALVLTRDGVTLWAVGLRASRHFAVTPRTLRYIELTYKPGGSHC